MASEIKQTSEATDTAADLIRRRQHLLGPAYRLFYERPVHLVRGEGVWLFDADGNRYLDAYNNVASVGHCHPRVVEALATQAATLNTHTRYLHETVLDYAERLLAKFPGELSHVMFTCTGSEANDLALRIARAHTGNDGFIITRNAYHGVTTAVAELSPSLGAAVQQGPHVRLVPAPDPLSVGSQNVGQVFAANVRAAIADLRAHGLKPACLLLDTIFSSDGILPDPEGFLVPAVEEIRGAGGVFIADEVQPGFARVGEAWWGFARHGVVPDIVTLGKPMGNGHPLAGAVMRPEVVAEFGRTCRYFNTFGGNPVSSAVGMAVLDVIDSEGLADHAEQVGLYTKQRLEALSAQFSAIGEVRGAGLFVAVDLIDDQGIPAANIAAALVNRMRERGVLISATGPNANVLKIRPPLVFSRENTDQLVDVMKISLQDIADSTRGI